MKTQTLITATDSEAYTPTISSIIIDTPSEKHAERLAEFASENLQADADYYGKAVQLYFWDRLDPKSFGLLWGKINSFTSNNDSFSHL